MAFGMGGLHVQLLVCGVAAIHYGQPPCGVDEVQAEVLGVSGFICTPRCDRSTFSCASDVPMDTTAAPQCMLRDVDQGAFCGLVCQSDSQCPSGAQCKTLLQVQVGVCLFPTSFTDWVRSATTKKLSVGWPSQPSGNLAAEVSRSYTSLQNLKQKFNIDDGDADMITIKEYLASLSGGGAQPQSMAVSMPMPVPVNNPASSNAGTASNGLLSPWLKDINYFLGNMESGVPGIQREVHDTIWNIEHIEQRGRATELLRGTILLGLFYLVVGSAINYQMHGARGPEVIPHLSFWSEYPKLVNDGVAYAKIIVGCGGGGFGGKSETLSGGLSGGLPMGSGLRDSGGLGAFESL